MPIDTIFASRSKLVKKAMMAVLTRVKYSCQASAGAQISPPHIRGWVWWTCHDARGSRISSRSGVSPDAAPIVICAAWGVPQRWETLAQKVGIMCSRAAMVRMRDWPIMFTSSAVVMPTRAMADTTNLHAGKREESSHCSQMIHAQPAEDRQGVLATAAVHDRSAPMHQSSRMLDEGLHWRTRQSALGPVHADLAKGGGEGRIDVDLGVGDHHADDDAHDAAPCRRHSKLSARESKGTGGMLQA